MPNVVQIKIYRDLDPMERWRRFHKPLDEALQAANLGEVTGGGTLDDLDTERVLYSDLHVRVTGDLDQALGVIRATLVRRGAPPDTQLCVDGGADIGLELH